MYYIKEIFGIFMIFYGFIMSAIERFMGMEIWGSPYQQHGIYNGFMSSLVGSILVISTVQQFFFISLPIILINIIEQVILLDFLKRRNKKYIGKEGKAISDINKKCKGKMDILGEVKKVYSQREDIKAGDIIYISDTKGYTLIVEKLK